ncbi:LysR family transcriptional regulator [Aerophototrophica crusticola]|uniref:LysR family transcriptional regulator n=1 Tax=Aerophototrophica crusticola TaxID=1709002 RepID=A0A858R6W0_9PROT|nr:LysR family transcriptional regulator [Rhodospirillaceae bacterium B3]
MMTLRQIEIFWAIAHADSLTKASKVLGLAQPSLSQQLAKLEEEAGNRLFNRAGNNLELTDAGRFLLRKAEAILANMDEVSAGMTEFRDGARGVVSIGVLNSVGRTVLPLALAQAAEAMPGVEIDIHEVAPAEALELLYGRRITMAVLGADSIAATSASFQQVDLLADPQVLAVPRSLDLSAVKDLDRDLGEAEKRVLNNCIQFNFGNQRSRRVEQWYRDYLPRHRVLCQTRTYEVALSMVEAGAGVALVPALAAKLGPHLDHAVNLYRVPMPERRLVALAPPQNLRVDVYSRFLAILKKAAGQVTLPDVRDMPPFLAAGPAEWKAVS